MKEFVRSNVRDIYPLTALQKGLLHAHLLYKENDPYFRQVRIQLTGTLHPNEILEAFDRLFNHHDTARTIFTVDNLTNPMQVVLKHRKSESGFYDWTGLTENQYQARLNEFLDNDLKRKIDLTRGPLMRLFLIRKEEHTFDLIWSYHHIIMDGWCHHILINDLFTIYAGLVEDRDIKLDSPPLYSDYVKWLGGKDHEKAVAYWRNYLYGFENKTSVPNYSAETETTRTYEAIEFSLSVSQSDRLRTLCAKHGVSLNAIIQSIWGILLSYYTQSNDVVFGAVTSGRSGDFPGIDRLIGLLINTIPVRLKTTPDTPLIEIVKTLHSNTYEAEPHAHLPLTDIFTLSALKNNLFDHFLIFQNYPIESDSEALTQRPFRIKDVIVHEASDYPLYITISPNAEQIKIVFRYDRSKVSRYFLRSIEGHVNEVINSFDNDLSVPLRKIRVTSGDDLIRISKFNQTVHPYPKDETIVSLIQKQVSLTPEAPAIRHGRKTITFKQLEDDSDRVAGLLQSRFDIKPGDGVGVLMDRSERMIVALLAVLKCGGAYVPVDPFYPVERINYILKNANVSAVVIDKAYDELPLDKSFGILLSDEVADQPTSFQKRTIDPSDLAYIIYTSGSSGNPKGCMLEHEGVINRIFWMWHELGFHTSDIILQKTANVFDVSVWEIFMPLCFGAQLTLCSKETAFNPEALISQIEEHQVATIHFVPGMYAAFLSALDENSCKRLRSLKRIIASGESLTSDIVQRHYALLSVPLINLYGPTEASVDVTFFNTKPGNDKIPIGKPIWNMEVLIMDSNFCQVPIGMPGEIWLKGIGVARGYVNNTALTDSVFKLNDLRSERTYKTGDLGVWLPDGNILYLGRKDNQVKLRGYRIELEEIESRLTAIEGIDQAVVLIVTMDKNQELVAYLSTKTTLDVTSIRSRLRVTLPDFMIPSHFVRIPSIPFNTNGKVDRKLLAGYEVSLQATKQASPIDPIERGLMKIWMEILHVTEVDVEEDFFELGGHSLKAIQLMSAVNKEFGLKIDLGLFFSATTVRRQAELVRGSGMKKMMEIKPAASKLNYALSLGQQRIWISENMLNAPGVFNIPNVYSISGSLNLEALQSAWVKLVTRHEALRTSVIVIDGEPRQVVSDQVNIPMIIDQQIYQAEKIPISVLQQEAAFPFKLESGPLARLRLFKHSGDNFTLVFTIHHIICDGWSMEILFKDLFSLYVAEVKGTIAQLPELRITFKDFSEWHSGILKSDTAAEWRQYWQSKLSGVPSPVTFPADVASANSSHAIAVFNFKLDEASIKGIQLICARNKTTPFVVVLTLLKVLIYRHTAKTDITMGTPVTGRFADGLDFVVGCFVNLVALRDKLDPNNTFATTLSEMQGTINEAQRNQIFPYELIDSNSQHPNAVQAFDVGLSWEVTTDKEITTILEQSNLSIKTLDTKLSAAKYNLWFYGSSDEERVSLHVKYKPSVYRAETIQKIGLQLVNLIIQASENDHLSLAEFDLDNITNESTVAPSFDFNF